ncbi:O-antigen translocase [Flaviramulus sp. BrNp1-15]|uniref:O-antigen translocase n=1 Tax=Flaviramulus sp. BrNp1-15 TaxID=2916754 RepID=UPI001EE89A58|nr:O-antigen translocase [Flaviramulus sp. BrNp1-15]ULC58999.1 O-antigen translocase [Flaviramulus sp. BrNp1-15]
MFKKLFGNTLIKVFSYNSIVVFGKLISSFVVSKISAIYLGPSGYAIVGNLKNVLQGVIGITASGFESGIIKYTAENKNNTKHFNIIVSSAITLSVIISLITGLLLFLFANSLSIYVLKDLKFAFVFKCFAFILPLISLNFLVVYIFNGLQKFKTYSVLLTLTNILNALLSFLFIYYLNLKGALLASIMIPALSFLCSLFIKDIRSLLVVFFVNIKNISVNILKSISTYIVMATYSSILISLTYLFIRNKIILDLDLVTAGLWEAMNKISTFYMIFFSSLVTLYLLPQLAVNKTISGYVTIMKTYFSYLIPFLLTVFILLLFCRTLVIKLFLTNEFQSIEQYFYLQLIGDFIKILAFSLAYQFHAKKMVTIYFITDTILYLSFYFLSTYLINYYFLKGVFYAYIISTSLYLIFVIIFLIYNNANYLKEDA